MSSYIWIDKTTELVSAFSSDISLNPSGDDCGGGGAYIQSLAYDSISKKLYSGGFYSSSSHVGSYVPFVCSSTTGGSTWNTDASSIWQAFNGDISFNSCGGGFVAALAYDSSNNKLFAGGQYSSQIHAGNYEPFVCSLNDASGGVWNKDASNIWQAFNGDISLNNGGGGGGGYVSALAYDSSASKIFAGGSYSSISNTNAYVPFVCSATNGGSTWSTTDASNIWLAFNGDISLNNGGGGGGGYVAALAYDSSASKLFAGGVYSSQIHAGNYEPFVCSSSNNGITWTVDASSIWQAFNGDISFNNGGGGGAVYTLAYNSGNSKLFAGGYYSSNLYAGNYELFVCSSSNNGMTWAADASSIWQAFNGDISFNNPDGGGYVSALTYDSSNNKLYAGGLYSSKLYAGNYEAFVCSLADGSSTWTKEIIPNSGSGGSIRAVVIDDVIAVGNDEFGNPIMYITSNDIPIFPICFPAGTPIQTDQGIIAIERINPDIHTINKKPIIDITKTITLDKYLIGFKKNALEKNYPTDNTLMSQEHKVYYQGKMREAKTFLGQFEKVVKVKYNGEILYNVLMEDYSQIRVNNLICETLHPDSTVAKLYTKKGKYTDDVRDNIIVVMLKECIQKKDYESYNRIIGRC